MLIAFPMFHFYFFQQTWENWSSDRASKDKASKEGHLTYSHRQVGVNLCTNTGTVLHTAKVNAHQRSTKITLQKANSSNSTVSETRFVVEASNVL